ncbi:MAG: glycosyltransferase family 4 protein [Deltaproteobacteria bacterium]|nr:glycosyltransferase family 4 protein [Deltaproteobacteria bacterium]
MRIGFVSVLDQNLVLFRLELMKALILEGHEVFAITPEGKAANILLENKITPLIWPMERFSLSPIKLMRSINILADIIKANRLDTVHAFMLKPCLLTNLACLLIKNVRVLNTLTGLGIIYTESTFKYELSRYLFELFGRLIFLRANAVIFQNKEDLEILLAKGVVSQKKASVIRGSGIDCSYWQNDKLVNNKDKILVLMAARAIKQKGFEEYFAAAETLNKEFPPVEFWLACFPEKHHPFALSDQLFKSKKGIKYLGYVQNMKELLRDCDIFVYPSYYREGIPRALLEACSMGKALVSTDQVGCREVVTNGLNGFTVKPKDSVGLVKALRNLITNPAQREQFGVESRKIALEYFDTKKINSQYLELYNKN